MPRIIYEKESYEIIGILFEVHKNLGSGFLEIVYKDALEFEFKGKLIDYQREKEYSVSYKDTVLNHKFYADFIVYDKIILEIKCCKSLHENHIAQCLNYLKISKNKLAILVNFNKPSLEFKRIVL